MTAQEELARRISRDSICRAVQKKIDEGKADFSDTARYNDRAAELLGEVLAEYVPDMPPEARETLCKGLLRQRYLDTNAMLNAVQRTLDAAQGLHLAPQTADYPEERVDQAAHSLADETVPMETIQRRAISAPATIARSFQDDYIEKNASFRDSAGLKCYINRIAAGGCCKWCTAMAGRYRYGEEPEDVYRRHDNCSCTVTYESGRQRQDVWSKRTWEAPEPGAGAEKPTVFSQEQALILQKKHSLEVLTGGQKPAIINQKISDRMFNSHVYTDDEKKLVELGVIPFYEIEEALMASPIGRHVAQYIESQSMAIELDYISDSNGLSGEINDPFITVYVADMRTIEEVVETIVHETAHKQFDWQYTQEDEVNCRIYEYLSTHDEISEQKIHEIVDFVRENYSDFPEGNLYGY